MTRTTYHFTFKSAVPMRAVEDALLLAAIAARAVAGDESRGRRTTHVVDDRGRTCVIDARTAAGAALLRIFFAYVTQMFGVCAFRVVTAEDLVPSRRAPRRSSRR
jgi:hypothetical protein